jgi:N-formylglutamate amidohydrolase
MKSISDTDSPNGATWEILAPDEQSMPAVFSSPHSGNDYPIEFLAASRVDRRSLRHSEDSFVDEIFAAAPEHGAPLLRAFFPRVYLDANREPFELDPEMFEDSLPSYVNAHSTRVAAGLGTIARVVASGREIYKKKLRFADAAERINTYYRPYHRTLQELIGQTRARFGHCLLIDCHSMPSVGSLTDLDVGVKRVDFVIGDCFGASCAPKVTSKVVELLEGLGYRVVLNTPYSGGYTTLHYGNPSAKVHALQIEINRSLYMDEATFEPSQRMGPLIENIDKLLAALGEQSAALLTDQ